MHTVTLARNAMATRFEIILHGENENTLRAAGEQALEEISRLENRLSLYRAGSEIAQINSRAAREPVLVSPEVFALLQHAQRLSTETDGAFDITIAPLVRCWGFMGGTGKMPASEEIAGARALVGMGNVLLDEATRTIRFAREGVMLDLGAIGKGYAVERASEMLRDAGIISALIHGGTSTVCAIGHPPGESHWKISIDLPQKSNGASPFLVELRDESLSVSAASGRQFEANGKKFGHVIDPRTGWPTSDSILAAVSLASATETDALSTALLTLGQTGFEKFSRMRTGIRIGLVTSANGETEISSFGLFANNAGALKIRWSKNPVENSPARH